VELREPSVRREGDGALEVGGTFGSATLPVRPTTARVPLRVLVPAGASFEVARQQVEGTGRVPVLVELLVDDAAIEQPWCLLDGACEVPVRVAAKASCPAGTFSGEITIAALDRAKMAGGVHYKISQHERGVLPWLGPVDTEHRAAAYSLPHLSVTQEGRFGDEQSSVWGMAMLVVGVPTGKTRRGATCRYSGGYTETNTLHETTVTAYDPRSGESLAQTRIWPKKRRCTKSTLSFRGEDQRNFDRYATAAQVEPWALAQLDKQAKRAERD